jgi:mono/diheme cytochrome c family protein
MRVKIAAAFILLSWAAAVGGVAGAGQVAPGGAGASTTWSGVYTEEQAKTGALAYTKVCSECHLEDLAGDGFAPALKGPEFMNNWNSLTVGDLYERIRISMPPTDPGSVSAKEKADIVAFLLKSAGFPAGTTELAAEPEPLKAIKFEAMKPGSR